MPYCTSCGAVLTSGVRHACGDTVAAAPAYSGSEALLRAWAHDPSSSAIGGQPESTRKNRRGHDAEKRRGPVNPSLATLIADPVGAAALAATMDGLPAEKSPPVLEDAVLSRAEPLRDSVYVPMPPIPAAVAPKEPSKTVLSPRKPPVIPVPRAAPASNTALVPTYSHSKPPAAPSRRNIINPSRVVSPPRMVSPPRVVPAEPASSTSVPPSLVKASSRPALELNDQSSSLSTQANGSMIVNGGPSTSPLSSPKKASPAVPPKPREWRRTVQIAQPHAGIPPLASPSSDGSGHSLVSPPVLPPKPTKTVQITAPPSPTSPKRSDIQPKNGYVRGSAPPGVYSRKLLEEETLKYKKEQEAESKAAAASSVVAPTAEAPAEGGAMRKWAVRYKAIEKTYTQAEGAKQADGANGTNGLQKSVGVGRSPRKKPAAAAEENTQRALVIREIIATEEDYISYMSCLLRVWLEPIAHKRLLDRKFEELNLHTEISLMLQVNNELLTRFKTSGDVGAAIIKMSAFLKLYTQYCVKESEASAIVAKCIKTEPFASFSEYTSSRPECRSLDMRAFMIKPIQRLCQYPLLLGQLKKETPANHPEYANLCTALDLVQETVLAINARKAELESMARVRVLAEQLRGWADPAFRLTNSAHRRLLQEGTALSHNWTEKEPTLEPVSWYLFSDFLAVSKSGTVIEKIVGVSQEVQHVVGQFWSKDSMWRLVSHDAIDAVELFRKGLSVVLTFPLAGEKENFAKMLAEHLQPWDDVQVIVFQANQPAKERKHKSSRDLKSKGHEREKKEKKSREPKEAKEGSLTSLVSLPSAGALISVPAVQLAVPPIAAAPAISPSPSPRQPPINKASTQTHVAVALYSYSATADTELSLKANDVVTLISTESPDWWYGTTLDGRSGYFPASYAKIST